jgi:hypothetical protein
MTSAEIEAKIERFQKGIDNPAVADNLKSGMRQQVEMLKAQLDALQETKPDDAPTAGDDAPTAGDDAPTAGENAPKGDDQLGDKKPEKPKHAGVKVTPENKAQAVDRCNGLIQEIKLIIAKHDDSPATKHKKSEKTKKKRASEIVSEGISSVVGRVVKLELTRDKVGKIKPQKLRDARDKFKDALKNLRSALGGISSENDQFIEDFEKHFNSIIDAVEEKQKTVKASEKEPVAA